MKTRHNFVSNSSSTSFVLMTSVAGHTIAMLNLTASDRLMMMKVVTGLEVTAFADIGGVIVISGQSCSDGEFIGNLSITRNSAEYDNDMDNTVFFQNYRKLLPEKEFVYRETYS